MGVGPHVAGKGEPPKGVALHVGFPIGEPTAKVLCGDPRESENKDDPWKLARVGPGNTPGAGAPGND